MCSATLALHRVNSQLKGKLTLMMLVVEMEESSVELNKILKTTLSSFLHSEFLRFLLSYKVANKKTRVNLFLTK